MLRLTAKIQIKSERLWEFEKINAVEVERDTEKLTDTCRLTLAKKMRWDDEKEIPVKRGDKVTVWLGYDGKLELAFRGYVRTVTTKTPVVIECEDEMYMLKQKATVKKAYRSVTLQQLLEDQQTGYTVKVAGEQRLGAYRVTADTVAGLLDNLQEQGIRSFFRMEQGEAVLWSGVVFKKETTVSQVLESGKNIVSEENLKQVKADEQKLRVKVISMMPNNKKVTVEAGDKDGELRTIHCYNKTEAEAKMWGEQELERLKQDGLSGSITTFGGKLIDKLDAIGVKTDGRKMGVYEVKKNVIRYGTGGFRQEVTLGGRIS